LTPKRRKRRDGLNEYIDINRSVRPRVLLHKYDLLALSEKEDKMSACSANAVSEHDVTTPFSKLPSKSSSTSITTPFSFPPCLSAVSTVFTIYKVILTET
jgi:hypothetical protein